MKQSGVFMWRCFPLHLNSMFHSFSNFVRRCSPWLTQRYLHDLHAKKNVPIASCAIAICWLVTAVVNMVRRTQLGRAFCCFFFGSSFQKARNCRCRSHEGSLSSSLVGFWCPLARKVDTTCETEFLIELSAMEALDFRKNLPSRRAMAKAPMSWIF